MFPQGVGVPCLTYCFLTAVRENGPHRCETGLRRVRGHTGVMAVTHGTRRSAFLTTSTCVRRTRARLSFGGPLPPPVRVRAAGPFPTHPASRLLAPLTRSLPSGVSSPPGDPSGPRSPPCRWPSGVWARTRAAARAWAEGSDKAETSSGINGHLEVPCSGPAAPILGVSKPWPQGGRAAAGDPERAPG